MSQERGSAPSLLRQPKAVWAVAFACVISFMGIGLVDPILPVISKSLGASPSQVSLLFTSYLVVTALFMLASGWLSSRIGPKPTLVIGLLLVAVFSALAGSAGSVEGVIGFRGGWGVGNALFIATSLAVIVASATGGFSGAIILYEAALGLGIAVGPLVGGLLGQVSWRGPFYGVAVLMFIAVIATLLFVPKIPKAEHKMSLGAPVAALRHRGLLTMGVMAFLYNWGFFTMLGYAPYPMKLGALSLGFVFFGWGILVAAFAVLFAPRLQRRFGTAWTLYANLLGLGIVMIVIAMNVAHPVVVMIAVIVSGCFIGINNTLTTQAVMLVSPVERSVASAAYGFVRFIGGGIAPFVAGKVAESVLGQPWAFALGAFAFLLAIPVLVSGHGLLCRAENQEMERQEQETPQALIEILGQEASVGGNPVVAAIDGGALSTEVIDKAAELAASFGTSVDVVHVTETDVVGEIGFDPESRQQAETVITAQLERLQEKGIAARGVLLASFGTHAQAGHAIKVHADSVDARTVALGHSTNGPLAYLFSADVAGELKNTPSREVVVVTPRAA